jgi:molybdate transport system permease protein
MSETALSPILLSLQLAAVSTTLLVLIATPLAYVLAAARFPGKSLIEALLNLPMALPPTVMGYYLLISMGPRGVVGRVWQTLTGGSLLFTFSGIVMAVTVCGLPYALQPMKAAFQKIDMRMLEAAYVLGLSKHQAFFRVVIPNSMSGMAAGAILVFLHTMGAFGLLLMVGGSIQGETKVASIAMYEAVECMNYHEAGVIALCLLPISYGFLVLVNRLNKEAHHAERYHEKTPALF